MISSTVSSAAFVSGSNAFQSGPPEGWKERLIIGYVGTNHKHIPVTTNAAIKLRKNPVLAISLV